MKKYIFLFILALAASQCGTIGKAQHDSIITPPAEKRVMISSWPLYSSGLYCKSQNEYNKAIKYFLEAASYKVELPRIYYQLAECYFNILDYEKALSYSNSSIKEDKYFDSPYTLSYRIHFNMGEYQKAAASLESLLNVKPELFGVYYTLGFLYFNQLKNFEKARHAFERIIDLSATVSVDDYYIEQACYYLGRIYYNEGLVEKALVNFYKVVEINPENNTAYYLLIRILMDRYEFEKAKELAHYYTEKFSDNLFVYSALGRIYYIEDNPRAKEYLRKSRFTGSIYGILSAALYDELLKKDGDGVEAVLRNITKQDPMLISPHIALGRIALRKENEKEALTEFFTAGVLLYKAKLYGEAGLAFYRVLSINDKIPEVYLYLGKIYEETAKYNLALINLKKSNELQSGMEILIHIGYIYSIKNEFREAAGYFDMAIKSEPENPQPYFFKGLLFSQEKNFPQAEIYIKRAIKLNETNDNYYFFLATVLEKQNRLEETIESLKTAIKHNPKNAMACNFLGYLYADNNMNLDESIALIEKALEFSPSNGAFLDSLGWAYYRKGNFEFALKSLLEAEDQLEKEKSPDPVVFDHIGDAYSKIGERNKAMKYWKKSLQLKKDEKIEKKILNSSNSKS